MDQGYRNLVPPDNTPPLSQALKLLEESRPVFEVAAKMRSAVLQDVAELIAVKHQHIAVLSTICRAWMQCVNG